MLIQPSVLGGGFWFLVWCLILCYILELNQPPKQNQLAKQSTRKIIVNNFTKLIIAIASLLPMPIFAQTFDLWSKTSGNIEQSLDLLRTVSNLAVSVAIGGTTAYIAYRQYQINRASWRIQAEKEMREYCQKRGIPYF